MKGFKRTSTKIRITESNLDKNKTHAFKTFAGASKNRLCLIPMPTTHE